MYLRMLQEFMLPKIADRERRDEFVFQQDGARCHTTQGVRQWLAEQFGVVISGPLLAEWPWPANSPDLTGCDYWLWGHLLQEIRRMKPESLKELKDIVDTHLLTAWIRRRLERPLPTFTPGPDSASTTAGGISKRS